MKKKPVKKITADKRLQLIGLLALGREHMKTVDACERLGEKILGEPPNSGSHFGDAIYGNDDGIDQVLRKMNVVVVKKL